MANPVVFFDLALGGMFCLSHVILISVYLRLLFGFQNRPPLKLQSINSSQVERGFLSLVCQMLFVQDAVRLRGGSSAQSLDCSRNLDIVQNL